MLLVVLVGRHDRAEVFRQVPVLDIPRIASDGRRVPSTCMALPRLLHLVDLPKVLLARMILLR